MLKGVSVIICCYNSALRLPKTLEHLANQKVNENFDWEIILVDNLCTDNTVKIAKEEWFKYENDINLHILLENKAGLTNARKKGIENAKYQYCVFCDDDNWFNPNYIEIMYQTFLLNENIGIIGGNGIYKTEVTPPDWFTEFAHYYATGPQASQSGYVTKERRFVFGAGMGIKKTLFETIENLNFKTPLTDRKGDELTSGGDTQLCYLSILIGAEIYYNSALIFTHFISKERLTEQYLYKLFDGFAIADSYLSIFYNYLNEPFKNFRTGYFNQLIYLLKFIRIYKKPLLKISFYIRKPEITFLLTRYYLKQFKLLILNRKRYYTYIVEINKVALK